MRHRWFAPWGWLHRPVSWQGWLVTVAAAVFCIHIFLAVDRRSHSVSDTLYGIFPFVVPCLMLVDWVAGKTSASEYAAALGHKCGRARDAAPARRAMMPAGGT
jgi:hypothetical protein